MGKFFNVDFNPDIVDGDISEANGTDIAGSPNMLTSTIPTEPSKGARTHSVFVEIAAL